MICDEALREGNQAFLNRLSSEGRRRRVPMSGGFALTHRCNLACQHCYAGPDRSGREPHVATERWLSLVDEVADAGCLFFLLTGGEPLLHPDFRRVYRHAKERGMYVTVFTNGTLIDDTIMRLFKELPPHAVEISLYGDTAETNDAITGVTGSFDRACRGVERLLEEGMKVRLKSILMKPNLATFSALRALAEETYGVHFRMDGAMMPRLNGDRAPLALRVSPAAIAEVEMSDSVAREKWLRVQRDGARLNPSPRLYECGAGVIGFHVDADGMLLPCLTTQNIAYDLKSGSFAAGWDYVVKTMDAQLAAADLECASCSNSVMCGWCPSYSLMENGDANRKSEFLCELGKCRRELLEKAI